MHKDIYKRLARTEAVAASLRANLTETMQRAYKAACEERNEEQAAELARRIRTRLLEMSDSQMSLDRLGLDTSSASKFIASLKGIFSGEWAAYRQALRDIPEQPGFPFDVVFPTPPGEETKEDKE